MAVLPRLHDATRAAACRTSPLDPEPLSGLRASKQKRPQRYAAFIHPEVKFKLKRIMVF
jgi:hypothetical protein